MWVATEQLLHLLLVFVVLMYRTEEKRALKGYGYIRAWLTVVSSDEGVAVFIFELRTCN